MRLIIGPLLALAVAGCGGMPAGEEVALRYLALGDSYTIGTSVAEAERWPNQLVARLGPELPTLELVANLGVNGYTSGDLIVDELPLLADLDPQFATVQIGVNDVVQALPFEEYEANVTFIIERLVDSLGADRVLCVATPDYTVTPVGAAGMFGPPSEQRAGIERVNAILEEVCTARDVRFVADVFALSQLAADDLTLVATDGLHPSGAQYATWVDVIAPVVEELLGR